MAGYKNYSEEMIKNELNMFIEDYMDEPTDDWKKVVNDLITYEPQYLDADHLAELIVQGTMFGDTPCNRMVAVDRNGWMDEYDIPLSGKFRINAEGRVEFQDEDNNWISDEDLYWN